MDDIRCRSYLRFSFSPERRRNELRLTYFNAYFFFFMFRDIHF